MIEPSDELLDEIEKCVSERLIDRVSSIMLYGSGARGRLGDQSDVDLLVLDRHPRRPFRFGRVSVSTYTSDFLTQIAKQGSLYVLHLRREGITIRDTGGELARCLEAYIEPDSYEDFLTSLRDCVQIIACDEEEYIAFWTQFNRVAIFLLRSTLFAILASKNVF